MTLRYSSLAVLALILCAAFAIGCGSSSETPVEVPIARDETPPGISQVVSTGLTEVRVVFDEPVEAQSATNPANYTLIKVTTTSHQQLAWERVAAEGDTLAATGAALDPDGRTVVLTTETMDAFASYRIEIEGIADLSGNVGPVSKPVTNRIRSGKIFTIAGTGLAGKGDENVDPLASELYLPVDMTVGPDGLLYVIDWNNHRVRVIENGMIRTFIGTGELGAAEPTPEGAPLTSISLNHPTHVTFDSQGRLCLSAWHNSKILRTNSARTLIYEYCSTSGEREYAGDKGPAIDAVLNIASSTAFNPVNGFMYLSDQANQRIRMIDDRDIITTVVGNGSTDRKDDNPPGGFFWGGFCGDGGPAIDACLRSPVDQVADPGGKIAFDQFGNLYIADTLNHCIRRVDTSGIITTFAGQGGFRGSSGENASATSALMSRPSDVAVGPDGAVYIADRDNHIVRKVKNGVITTVAGQMAFPGFSGDGGAATSAKLSSPYGVYVDADENLYIADTLNQRIRVVYK